MADFKTTLSRLASGEVDFDAVAKNLDKLMAKQPRAAVTIMDQLKQAVVDGLIDAETYARLKTRIATHIEATPLASGASDSTLFAGSGDATQMIGRGAAAGDGGDSSEIFDITSGKIEISDRGEIFDITSGQVATYGSGPVTGIDFDPIGNSGPDTSSSWPTGGSQTGQTDTGFAHQRAPSAPTKAEVGATLRGRFRLEKEIGEGGMGSVFLGVDLIKERARDKRAKVALKVLNENFKEHPDAFISLQRESSRQQSLAHPNIATVFDFDQTDDGLAFLVMEYLDGEPLDKFIKTEVRKRGGLPFNEAFPMVAGLGAALVYAHERNLVHSDFKPGNCFLVTTKKKEKEEHDDTAPKKSGADPTESRYQAGQMKVLDFGIARAVKNPNLGEGEQTIFDPGKLGALTPAYASLEMLEGEEPDPRDDIYALACVAYELLTGKHPFNKKAANKARELGLVPGPIKGLTRKQWRGLERGLAFTREKRSQTTAQFLEEFEGKTSPWKNPLVMVPAVAVLVAAVSVVPLLNFVDKRDTEARIALASSGDPHKIEAVLSGLDDKALDSSKRDRVLTDAKEMILAYFDGLARGKIDVAAGKLDFTGARLVLQQANAYTVYKDSTVLKTLEEYIADAENRLLAEQFDKFNTALEQGKLLAVDNEDDIHDAMAVVAKIDPKHPMLKDRRLPGAFASAINTALEAKQFDYADKLGTVGVEMIGRENKLIIDLVDKIGGAKERAETAGRLLAAVDQVQKALDSNEGLAAMLKVRKELVDLAKLDPGNELLDKARKALEPRVVKDLVALEASHNWAASQLMLGDYSQILRALGLHDLNTRVGVLSDQFGAQVSRLRDGVTAAVAAAKLSPDATAALQQLATVAPHHSDTQNARDQIALAHLQAAHVARDAGDLPAASTALAAARQQAPSARVNPLLDAEATLESAEQALDASARAAALSQRKSAFDRALAALDQEIAALGTEPSAFALALTKLEVLRGHSPNDPRLATAVAKLAGATQKSADSLMQSGHWDDAVDLARNALVDLPQSSALLTTLGALEVGRKQAIADNEKKQVAAAKQALAKLLEDPTADRTWRANVRQQMGDIAAFGDPKDPWLQETGTKIAASLITRASAMRAQQRLAEGANLLADAERYAADAPGLVEERKALATATEAFEREQAEQARLARIDGFKETFESQAKATDVANAAKTLESLRKEVGTAADPFVVTEAPRMLATAYYKLATQQAQDKHDFAAALKFAKACADLQPQRQECKLAVRDYTVDGNKQELDKTFARGEFEVGDALAKISEVQVLDPGAYSKAEGQWAQAVSNRFGALRTAGPANFNDLLKQAKDVFAGNQMIASIEPIKIGPAVAKTPTGPSSPIIAEIKSAIDKALLTKAKELLQKAAQSDGETPEIMQLKGIFNGKAKQVKDVVTGIDMRVTEGSGLIAQWQQDHADATNAKAKAVLVAAREELDGAFAIWADSTALQQRKLKIADELARLTAGPHAESAAPPAPPTDPCEAKLAGYGKRKAGTCFYFVSGKQPGPYMVVVPAGEGISKPFAIGKYEVTVADFNRYCRLSGKCQPNTTDEGALPITGITVAQAKEFLDWLSERTGQKFRLPTVAEWTYAATAAAAGEQPKKDYNCRVEQGGQLLKGQGTMGVNTGKANGWGLYNYVGNAQEWATAGSGVVARGGAFEDSFSKCDISLEKAHSGTADHATGFRALLELGS